jgi:hypothetical protein
MTPLLGGDDRPGACLLFLLKNLRLHVFLVRYHDIQQESAVWAAESAICAFGATATTPLLGNDDCVPALLYEGTFRCFTELFLGTARSMKPPQGLATVVV